MKARRYQLRKEAVSIVERGHPWIFREQLSSAATVFADGDWLRLVDGQNQIIGHGIYESEGAIAIRLLRTGPDRPDAAWLRATLRAALAKRAELANHTDGIRLIHGESDNIPAVVIDRFGETLVVASYSSGTDALARYIARALVAESTGEHRAVIGSATNVVLRPARRRRGPAQSARALRGSTPDIAHFTEGGLRFAVDLEGGHKTGTYLDLRGLRRALATSQPSSPAVESMTSSARLDVRGTRVLNTFAYTGMLCSPRS
jgi:23S rRNA (cytosine1962-C5)-methyltransferase